MGRFDILHQCAAVPGTTIPGRDPHRAITHRDDPAAKVAGTACGIILHKDIHHLADTAIGLQPPACRCSHKPTAHPLGIGPEDRAILRKPG